MLDFIEGKPIDHGIASKKFSELSGWLAGPDDPKHPYNADLEDETAANGAVRALMNASIIMEYLDSQIPELIARARLAGESWSQIGESMGVTKQAAQQYYERRRSA